MLWKRTGAIVLGTTRIDFAAPGGTLAVEFHIKKTLKAEPNTAEVKVWNLAPETRKKLETPKRVPVQLDVGYGGDDHTLYVGQLRSAESVIEGANIVTTLSSGDSEQAFTQDRAVVQIPTGADVVAAAKKVAATMLKTGTGNLDQVMAPLAGKLATGGPARTLQGLASKNLGQLARAHGLEWSIQDGAIQVLPIGGMAGDPSTAVLLTSSTGMVGSPTVDNKGVLTVKSLIQPGLFPGRPIKVEGALLSGMFRIESAEFSGGTWTDDWTVTIHGRKW